ncbi:hypothetical protein [Kordia sp.]|uniref:hypothetical protein n=1 Tax=Kordia sp. TaxID=1965332 RepID=UPI0025BF325A|nr:hypothetical protein [Kordia sp.]MCH2196381.1 hypothetical protein [Kordia sp.]
MFQLYKSRDFGLFFKDTFDFLKLHGAHFFKNYLIVNGFFLVILIGMSYLLHSELAEMQVLGLLDENNEEVLFDYLRRHSSSFITYGIFYVLLGAFVGILNYSYVPFYFKLYEKHQGANFSYKEISNALFSNFGKLIKFILATILISIPLLIATSIVMAILTFTLIGIPFILFVVAFISLFYHSAIMEYIKSDNKGVFDCYGYSLQLCFQSFFPAVGAVGIFMLITGVFQYVLGLTQEGILYFIGISVYEDPTYLNDLEKTSFIFMIAFILQIAIYLINFIISAIIQIHQAIVYYGLKEDRENIYTRSAIDHIGKG